MEEQKSLTIIILSWILRYASYAVLSFAALHCVGVLAMSYSAATQDPDFSFTSSFQAATFNMEISNAEGSFNEKDIIDVFMILFTALTIVTELGGFLIKKYLKKDITMSFKQKFWLGSAVITAISLLGLTVAIISQGWTNWIWILIAMFIVGMVISCVCLLVFLALRWISEHLQEA